MTSARKEALRAQYLRMLEKERAIGTDPLYLNGPRKDREVASKLWKKTEKKYLESQ